MAEPIEIIIRKGTGGEGTGFGIPGAQLSEQATGRSTSNNFKDPINYSLTGKQMAKTAFGLGLIAVKRSINYGISQYGNMTGNYIQQAEIELGLEHLNNISVVGLSIYAGAKLGGPVGAVIGGVTAGFNIGLNYQAQYITLQTNIAKLNTYSNIMQERSGNTYNNDSRGTYN